MALLVPWMERYGFDWRRDVDLSKVVDATGSVDATVTTVDNTAKVNTYDPSNSYVINAFKHQTADPVTAASGGLGIIKSGSTITPITTFFGVPTTNKPIFSPGQEILESNKAIGESAPTAGAGYNFKRGILAPSTTYELEADPKTITPFFWNMFQKGSLVDPTAGAGGDQYYYTFKLPTAAQGAEPEMFANLINIKGGGSEAESHLLSDAVGTSLRLSSAENEALLMSQEFTGRHLGIVGDDAGFSQANVVLNYAEVNPYLWQNVLVVIEDEVANNHVVVDAASFELTLTAIIALTRYNSKFPKRFVITGYTIDGSLSIPWSAANVGANYFLKRLVRNDDPSLVDLSPIEVDLFWFHGVDADISNLVSGSTIPKTGGPPNITDYRDLGTDTNVVKADKDLMISVGAVPKEAPTGGDNEILINLSFSGANIRSGNVITQDALEIAQRDSASDYDIT